MTPRAACARLLLSVVDAAYNGAASPDVLDPTTIFLALVGVIGDEMRSAGMLSSKWGVMKVCRVSLHSVVSLTRYRARVSP